MRKLLLPLFSLLLSCSAWAWDTIKDGIYYNVNKDLKEATVTFHNSNYNSYSGDIVIPSSIIFDKKTYNVTSIGICAFTDCPDLTSIEIPNSIKYIGRSAFMGCSSLTSIEIPNSVISIQEWAFALCSGLTSIEIPKSVGYIGDDAFTGCINLSSVTINSNSMVSKTYTSSSNIGDIFGNVKYILGDEVTSIGDYAFYDSGMSSIVIPNSVTSIGNYAFSGCKGLSSLDISNGVKSVGNRAFYNCTGLTSIKISSSVTSIGDYAFFGCGGLTLITCEANTPPKIYWNTFDNKSVYTYVPAESVDDYKNSSIWEYFSNILPIVPANINAIENGQMTNDKYFDFGGREIPTLQKGMNIVKKANGQTVKVLVK